MHISILMSARHNEINWNRVRVKCGQAAGGDGRGRETPIYALMPDQQMFFHYFRLFSPFITCRRQRQWQPGEPQQQRNRNYKWSQGQVKWVVEQAGRKKQGEQYCLQNKRVLTSSLEQFVKSPPQLQPFDWAGEENEKKRRKGAVLFHIKVNEFTTSNCGAKLIEKVYFASRRAIPFSNC